MQSALAVSMQKLITNEERSKLHILDAESRKLDSKRLKVTSNFKHDLVKNLESIGAFEEDSVSGSSVNNDVVKADYIIASRYRRKLCDAILSTDLDFQC